MQEIKTTLFAVASKELDEEIQKEIEAAKGPEPSLSSIRANGGRGCCGGKKCDKESCPEV